jgi:hypothetical protein
MCEAYNGWENWETWNMNLWINEVPDLIDSIYAYVKTNRDEFIDEDGYDTHGSTASCAKFIEELCMESFFSHLDDDILYGPASDAIYVGYLSMVNWYEIAKHFVHDAGLEEE